MRWAIVAIFALNLAGCGGGTTAMSPGTAAALGGQAHPCPTRCPTGSWCDADTGACIRAQSTATTHAPPHAIAGSPEALEPGLSFLCATADGLADEVVASDIDAATRTCSALEGETCSCRPPQGQSTE